VHAKTFKLTGEQRCYYLYILAFTILALIAVSNLIRNLVMFSVDRDRNYPWGDRRRQTEAPTLTSRLKLR